jgi:hypothetical protein
VITRKGSSLWPQNVFELTRLEQLTTRGGSTFLEPLRSFEQLVPSNATVAIYLPPNVYEYPLFGEKLTRHIIPISQTYDNASAKPCEADYLLYSKSLFQDVSQSDIYLGLDWYLRNIKYIDHCLPSNLASGN